MKEFRGNSFIGFFINSRLSTLDSQPFLEDSSHIARRYNRLRYFFAFLSLLMGLGYLLVMILWFSSPLAAWVESRFPRRYIGVGLYALVFFPLYDLIEFPLSWAEGHWLEKKFGLSARSFFGWFWEYLKRTVLSLLMLLVLMEALYLCMDLFRRRWWMALGVLWFIVTVVLGRIFPQVILPLFYRKVPIEEKELLERFRSLARGTGLDLRGIFRVEISRSTRKANAALAGWGSTRQVLLADTLLDSFRPEEIEVVLAHELGHHVAGHTWKLLVFGAAAAALGFWVGSEVLSRAAETLGFSSPSSISAFPLLALVLTLLGLVMLPLQNTLSRHFERSSDRYALKLTRNPEAFENFFVKLARLNLAETQPNRIIEFLFHTHPSIARRLQLAQSYRQETERAKS